jgi:hypothetical protein
MHAIEFETVIEGNLVKLPLIDAKSFAGKVKVIILQEESVAMENIPTLIDELLVHPLDLPDFTPLSRMEIYAEKH